MFPCSTTPVLVPRNSPQCISWSPSSPSGTKSAHPLTWCQTLGSQDRRVLTCLEEDSLGKEGKSIPCTEKPVRQGQAEKERNPVGLPRLCMPNPEHSKTTSNCRLCKYPITVRERDLIVSRLVLGSVLTLQLPGRVTLNTFFL